MQILGSDQYCLLLQPRHVQSIPYLSHRTGSLENSWPRHVLCLRAGRHNEIPHLQNVWFVSICIDWWYWCVIHSVECLICFILFPFGCSLCIVEEGTCVTDHLRWSRIHACAAAWNGKKPVHHWHTMNLPGWRRSGSCLLWTWSTWLLLL